MPCIDPVLRSSSRKLALLVTAATVSITSLISGCGSSSGEAPGDARGGVPPIVKPSPPTPLPVVPPSSTGARPSTSLPAPATMRSWVEVRRQAAQRIVAANPNITYMGKVPEMLLAIPVLEIELNGDGSIRNIEILRPPTQAKDTLQIAADAVRRAGPFGDVSKLPKPWKFVETFLFDDARKFKPRTLDN